MPGLFNQIDLSAKKSPDSSIDLKILDTICDHRVVDEEVSPDISAMFGSYAYSGTNSIYNSITFSQALFPDQYVTVTTQYPMVDDGQYSILQTVDSDRKNLITEYLTVPNDVTSLVNMTLPPKVNSLRVKEKVVSSNGQYQYIPFARYKLYQLVGKIRFLNSLDIGKTIKIQYIANKKTIPQSNEDTTLNYKFLGLNQQNQGMFVIYGRAVISPKSRFFLRYRTDINSCSKCLGSGYVNDLFFDQNGRMQLVYDFSKLIQDFFKRLYTVKGSNPLDITDGTQIADVVGISNSNFRVSETLIKSEIVNLLAAIREKQAKQAQVHGVGLAEQIAYINAINVQLLNATDLLISIEVVSKSGKTDQISTVVRS
jgi:hypothetical protein